MFADRRLAVLVAGQYSPLLVQLVTGPILARALGPADRGYLGVALILVSVIPVFASVGTPAAARRLIAEGSDVATARYAAARSNPVIFVVTVVMSVVAVYVWFSGLDSVEKLAIFVLLGLSYFGAVRMTILSLAVSEGSTNIIARYQIVGACLSGIGICGLAVAGRIDIVSVCIVYAVSQLGQFAAICRFGRGGHRDRKIDRKYALKSLPGQISDVLLIRVDQLLCSLFLGAHATGIYVVAFSYAFVAFPLVHSVGLRISGGKGREELVKNSVRIPLTVLFGALCFGVVWSAAAVWVVPLLFGSDYSESVHVAAILTFGVVLFSSATVNVQAALSLGRAHLISVIGLAAVCLEVVAVVVLGDARTVTTIAVVGVLASGVYYVLSLLVRQRTVLGARNEDSIERDGSVVPASGGAERG
ncbi:lipopolysaccharide biosynthesis protein [Rhodococcus jostii]|uniref:lipopolysaccharide biosynthesis protein n=1 Tax=Rhodococcus jostii TaxID=132919 RepID=UPI001474F55D|nr:oligosaccharide flippase family protein [Rhodococcus jostii]